MRHDLQDLLAKCDLGTEENEEETARAIRDCLGYLYGEAVRIGQMLTAHLIGAAQESIDVREGEAKGRWQ